MASALPRIEFCFLLAVVALPNAAAGTSQEYESHMISDQIWVSLPAPVDDAASHSAEPRYSFRVPRNTTSALIELEWNPQNAGGDHLMVSFDRAIDSSGLTGWESASSARLFLETTPDVREGLQAWVVRVEAGDDPSGPQAALLQPFWFGVTFFLDAWRPAPEFSAIHGRFEIQGEDPAPPPSAPAALPTPIESLGSSGWLLWSILALPLLPFLFRWRALPFGWLFSRLPGKDLAEHPRRAELVRLVREHPGIHFQAAMQALGIPNGSFRHHVAVLEAAGTLRVIRREGWACLVLPSNPALPPDDRFVRSWMLELMRAQPGIEVAALAKTLGRAEPNVRYHLHGLVAEGRVRLEFVRRQIRCYA